ncbi:MAG: fold metallo-hydrolase [Thermoleophilia bacterium]|nr:fold metallo-hydrolase [Thermoleophilia bacterium]
MIVDCSSHPDWRSNTYLVADRAGGTAVFVDAGGPVEPLMARAAELGVRVTHVLLTHEHIDHTAQLLPLEERFDADAVTPDASLGGVSIAVGDLVLRSVATPGHCDGHVAWIVEEDGEPVAAFTGDALFRGSVGGTMSGGRDGLQRLRTSILDVLLALPPDTVLYPGHMEQTTVATELADNPFVCAWRDGGAADGDPVVVAGMDATLLLEGPDYDGGTKAWVRFDDGSEAVVGGSMVSRAGART